LHAGDLAGEVVVVVWVAGHVLRELCCLAMHDNLVLFSGRLSLHEETLFAFIGLAEATFFRAGKSGAERIAPCYQCSVVQGIYDGAFQMRHHFYIVIVFGIVALDDADLSVYYHEFGVKRSKQRLVKVDDF